MKGFRLFLSAVLVFSLSASLPAYAAATASDAQENPVYGYIEDLLKEIDYDDMDDMEKLDLLGLYMSTLSGPGVASGSNADLSSIRSMLADIRQAVVPAGFEEVASEDVLVDEEGVVPLDVDGGFNIDRNVVIYVGEFNNQACRLVLPASTASTLWVDSDGALYNVGTSNVTGRLFYGDADLSSYVQYVFTLTPSLGNNASTLYGNGHPSFRRYYYASGGRITYTDAYGLFYVSEVVRTPSDVPADVNGYYLLVLVLIGGVQVLCLLRKLRS